MIKSLLLIALIAISCNSRKLETANLSGEWTLVNIEIMEIDSNKAIAELSQYPNPLFEEVHLKVENNSHYELSLKTFTYKVKEDNVTVEKVSTIISEFGNILDENEKEILWGPRMVKDNDKKSNSVISGSKKSGEYLIQYTLGRMPMKPRIVSEFSIIGDQLKIVNDYRISLFKNTTGFPKDEIQLKTRLTFKRIQ